MPLFIRLKYFFNLSYQLYFLFISLSFSQAFFYSMSGGCSCPTVVCPPPPPPISSQNCGGGGCGGGSCGGSGGGGGGCGGYGGAGGCSGGCGGAAGAGGCGGGGSSGGCVVINCDNGCGGSSGCGASSGSSGCSGSSSNCGGSTGGCGTGPTGYASRGSSGGCGGGSSSGCGGGSHQPYPSAPSSTRLTIECSKDTTTGIINLFNPNIFKNAGGGCSTINNCLPQQPQSNSYAKSSSGGGSYSSNNIGQQQQPTSGCSTDCSPPQVQPPQQPQQQQQPQQTPQPYNPIPPLPPQNYVAPSLPTAECQSATPNECNILPQPSINPQPAWSSGAGGTYAQKNNEGDRELLQQNKGEGYSGSDGGGFGQGNYEQSSTFPPLTTYKQPQQLPEQQPIQPPPISEPEIPPLPPTDEYLTSLQPEAETTETTTREEEEKENNYKRDPPAINVSGGKGNGGLNVQGNKLASAAIPAAKTNFENSFPMDLYGEDELALADYDEDFDTKTFTSTIKTTLKTTTKALETTSKKLFAVVPPEKATTTSLDDKDDILTNDYSELSFKKVHASPHSSDKLYSKLGTENSKCSSDTLRTIMHENIVVSPTISKQLIFSAGRLTFGASIDVICSRNRFSYTVVGFFENLFFLKFQNAKL